jgi:hypothetical protein
VDGWMDEWMGGWMGEWMDGWMVDGWMYMTVHTEYTLPWFKL